MYFVKKKFVRVRSDPGRALKLVFDGLLVDVILAVGLRKIK